MTSRSLEQMLVDAAVAEYVKTPEGAAMERLLVEAVRRERDEAEEVLELEERERASARASGSSRSVRERKRQEVRERSRAGENVATIAAALRVSEGWVLWVLEGGRQR